MPSAETRKRVADLHNRLMERFLNPSLIPTPAPTMTEAAAGKLEIPEGISHQFLQRGLAVAYALQHPDAPAEEIAKAAGCNKSTLYRWPWFRAFMTHRKEKRDRPHGFYAAPRDCGEQGGVIEAEDHRYMGRKTDPDDDK
jgi:hypothetical protein